MAVCVYLGFILKIQGLLNVLKFIIIANFFIILISLCFEQTRQKAQERGAPVKDIVNIIYGFFFACTLAYFGWFFYAGLDFITTILQISLYTKLENKEKE